MAEGSGVPRRAQRGREQERKLRDGWQAARATAQRWTHRAEDEQRVVTQLLTLTRLHWYLLIDRHWTQPGSGKAEAYLLLVGPGGVFVLQVTDGAEPQPEPGMSEGLETMVRAVEKATGELGLVPLHVCPVLVCGSQHTDERRERLRLLGVSNVLPALTLERQRLTPVKSRAIADHLERTFPGHERVILDAEIPAAGADALPVEADGLFSAESVVEEALQAAREAPIENWMTFLDHHQLPLVRRKWGGPARISGPAGTGKTVVGLHRAAHLAQRTSGRVLYVTFARNLPRVQATFLRTMAPYLGEKVDFRSLYGFTQDFLRERGIRTRLGGDKARTCFNRAWVRAGRSTRLEHLVSDPRYWQDEIAYVIKGRGITTFDAYASLPRRGRGRGTVPQRSDRQAVWALYETYEEIRTDAEVHDFQDVLTLALTELRHDPELSRYAHVIVDEAQDLPQIGVQLLHALVGDAPNGLLLIGDGQQAVYPGGFRLADAGIDVRGDRGQVLATNYRNAPQVLTAALEVVADVPFHDLDDTTRTGAREVELTCHDGRVATTVCTTAAEHDQALVTVLKETGDWPASAVLCATRKSITHYQRLLTATGIPVCLLEDYDGTPVEAVKLGSYTRAKGLDFKHVYLPRHDEVLKAAAGNAVTDSRSGQAAVRERGDLARSQLYVAMTRARDSLWLGSV